MYKLQSVIKLITLLKCNVINVNFWYKQGLGLNREDVSTSDRYIALKVLHSYIFFFSLSLSCSIQGIEREGAAHLLKRYNKITLFMQTFKIVDVFIYYINILIFKGKKFTIEIVELELESFIIHGNVWYF
jgi:hypothetical protein